MKGNEMLDIIGGLSPKYIEAAAAPKAKKVNLWKKYSAIAACLALLIGACAGSYVYIAEANEYKEAVQYFNDYNLPTDGLTRDEIREAYRQYLEKQDVNEKPKRPMYDNDVRNYADFKLYSAQKDSIETLRHTLTPGRDLDFPLDAVMDVSKLSAYSVVYHHAKDEQGVSDYTYFRDMFFYMGGRLQVFVDYLIPGAVTDVVDGTKKVYAAEFAYYESSAFVDFDIDLFKDGDVFILKDMYVDKIKVLNINDTISYLYNDKGELYGADILYENTFIRVAYLNEEGRVTSIKNVVEKLNGVIEYVFDPINIQFATDALRTAVTEAQAAVK